MKKIYALTLIVTVLTLQPVFASTDSNPTVKEQLENLNQCWKDKNFDDQILKERILLKDEIKLIQTHLSLVEQKLRDKNTDNLSTEQKTNRLKCLDILHDYWINGAFPKNLYHNKRTPYFIDNFGTACAVGQLIISSGCEDFAKKISNESNYLYIKELNEKYSDLKNWADTYGFTIDELAWIQPGYVICDTACNLSASISASGGQSPYTYLWNPSGQTSMSATGLCPATSYTCTVVDALGDTVAPSNCMIVFQATVSMGNVLSIPSASPVYFSVSSTNDNGTCNGTATATPTSGTPPYSYYWNPSGQITQTATGLCQGTYTVVVTDLNSCSSVNIVTVNLTTGITETKNYSFILFPNPATDKLFTSFENLPSKVTIYNTLGEIVLVQLLVDVGAYIDISSLDNGVYFITIESSSVTTRQKIIKNTP